MDFSLTDVNTFPAGTSVKAYPVSNWGGVPVNTAAAPPGSATDTQTMGNTGLTFTGLTAETDYVAYGVVNSIKRYVSFTPHSAGGVYATDTEVAADIAAVIDTDSAMVANSDTKVASQKATKTALATKQASLGFTAENAANKDTDTALAANSDTKYPSQKATKGYVDTATGLLIPKSLVDAKGDLFVGTADDTVARKAVGSDGQVLTADSTAGGGVKWATPSSDPAMGGDLTGTASNAQYGAGSIVNADVNASAGIVGSKLDLTSGTGAITSNGAIATSNAGGKTTLALTSTGSNTGITLGGDSTNLYRGGASDLRTDAINVYLATGGASLQFVSGTGRIGQFGTGAAATFDAAGDTILYPGFSGASKQVKLKTGSAGSTIVAVTSASELGFYGATPAARPSAYTQTYSTTTRTHANITASAVATTAATLASYGFTQAQADAVPVAINANATDIANVKQVLNQVIDDLQTLGLLQ